jgi:predicted nucleic acid-binding protein
MPRDRSLIETIEALVREQRRTTLRARTIAVTLKSSLDEFDRTRGEADPARRVALRREWSERAQQMIIEVRAEALRIRSIGTKLAAQADTTEDDRALSRFEELVVASKTTEVALEDGERIVLRGLADAG